MLDGRSLEQIRPFDMEVNVLFSSWFGIIHKRWNSTYKRLH